MTDGEKRAEHLAHRPVQPLPPRRRRRLPHLPRRPRLPAVLHRAGRRRRHPVDRLPRPRHPDRRPGRRRRPRRRHRRARPDQRQQRRRRRGHRGLTLAFALGSPAARWRSRSVRAGQRHETFNRERKAPVMLSAPAPGGASGQSASSPPARSATPTGTLAWAIAARTGRVARTRPGHHSSETNNKLEAVTAPVRDVNVVGVATPPPPQPTATWPGINASMSTRPDVLGHGPGLLFKVAAASPICPAGPPGRLFAGRRRCPTERPAGWAGVIVYDRFPRASSPPSSLSTSSCCSAKIGGPARAGRLGALGSRYHRPDQRS